MLNLLVTLIYLVTN